MHSTDIGVYVATHLLDGRPLFDILDDRFVTDRVVEHPFLLDELARNPAIRQVLRATQARGAPPGVRTPVTLAA